MADTKASSAKVTTFTYHGTDKRGQKTSGEIQSSSASLAKAILRKQGITPKKVSKKSAPLFGIGGEKRKPIKAADIAIFTRQMATMMKSGVPLIQAFEIVAEGADNANVRDMINGIKTDVAGGGSFASALEKHPKYFDDLFCSLIASGEQSGALETMLDRVATYKEKSEALKAKIKKALKYPLAVICVAIIVTAILLIKVVPQFASTFQSFGADLPAFTKMVVAMSDWMISWWYIVLGIIILAIVLYQQAHLRSKKFRDTVDALLLKAPIVSHIVHTSVYARFSRTLATTFAAGVPLVDALESVADAAGNVVYSNCLKRIKDEVTSGTQLNVSLRQSGMFPSMLLQMVAIGEESGALDEMLEKVAIHYEEEVDNAVDGLTAMMEPFIMSVLGVLVGGLMIAMYMPIFMMGQAI